MHRCRRGSLALIQKEVQKVRHRVTGLDRVADCGNSLGNFWVASDGAMYTDNDYGFNKGKWEKNPTWSETSGSYWKVNSFFYDTRGEIWMWNILYPLILWWDQQLVSLGENFGDSSLRGYLFKQELLSTFAFIFYYNIVESMSCLFPCINIWMMKNL